MNGCEHRVTELFFLSAFIECVCSIDLFSACSNELFVRSSSKKLSNSSGVFLLHGIPNVVTNACETENTVCWAKMCITIVKVPEWWPDHRTQSCFEVILVLGNPKKKSNKTKRFLSSFLFFLFFLICYFFLSIWDDIWNSNFKLIEDVWEVVRTIKMTDVFAMDIIACRWLSFYHFVQFAQLKHREIRSNGKLSVLVFYGRCHWFRYSNKNKQK